MTAKNQIARTGRAVVLCLVVSSLLGAVPVIGAVLPPELDPYLWVRDAFGEGIDRVVGLDALSAATADLARGGFAFTSDPIGFLLDNGLDLDQDVLTVSYYDTDAMLFAGLMGGASALGASTLATASIKNYLEGILAVTSQDGTVTLIIERLKNDEGSYYASDLTLTEQLDVVLGQLSVAELALFSHIVNAIAELDRGAREAAVDDPLQVIAENALEWQLLGSAVSLRNLEDYNYELFDTTLQREDVESAPWMVIPPWVSDDPTPVKLWVGSLRGPGEAIEENSYAVLLLLNPPVE